MVGYVGEQFGLPEAVQMLRSVKNSEPDGQWVVVSACDPLNVVGFLTPGERVPAVLANRVIFKDGVPLGSLENGNLVHRAAIDEDTLSQAFSLLKSPLRASRDSGTKARR